MPWWKHGMPRKKEKCMTAEYVAAHNSFCPVMFNIYVYWI